MGKKMQQRWFKMPVGASQNPVMRIIARKHEYDLSLVVMIYMVACELYQEENRKFQNDEELLDLIHIVTGDGIHVVQAVIQGLRERNVLNEKDFEDRPSANTERQRRFREKNKPVTGNADSNVTGNAVEREKEREKERPPLTPQEVTGEGDFGFEEFWKARPGRGNAPDSKQEAEKEFRRLITQGADADELTKAMKGYADWCRGAGKDGTRFAKSTSAFLSEGMFSQYVHQEGAHQDVDAGLDLPAWKQSLCQVLAPHQVRAHFKSAEFDGEKVTFGKKFDFTWCKNHYENAVRQVLGGKIFLEMGA